MTSVFIVTVSWGAHDPCAVVSVWPTREEAEHERDRLRELKDGVPGIVEVPLGEHRDGGWNW